MGQYSVFQRTSDGMFNATELLKQWNKMGNKKDLDDFLSNKSTKEYINIIESKESLNTQKSGDLKVIKTARGKNGGTWMHSFLFIDFAMWLNVEFKYEVIKFVYDQLIEYRNEAGNTYRRMCERIAQVSKKGDIPKNISSIAKAVNIVVYGIHEKQMRNKQAEESSMRELVKLQEMIIELIDNGYIKTYEGIRQYLLNTWRKKNQPKELTA